MTDRAKLIDLIKSGNLNLAIELSKGVELDIVELLVMAMDSTEVDKGVRLLNNYRIRYPSLGRVETDNNYWFCVDHRVIDYDDDDCDYSYTNFETPELLAKAILNLHNSLNND